MATDLWQHMNLVLCQRQLSAQSLSFEYGQTDNYNAMWQVLQQKQKTISFAFSIREKI